MRVLKPLLARCDALGRDMEQRLDSCANIQEKLAAENVDLEGRLAEAERRARVWESASDTTEAVYRREMDKATFALNAAEADRDALAAALRRCAAALRRYGRHDDGEVDGMGTCRSHQDGPETCDCGLDDALAKHGGRE